MKQLILVLLLTALGIDAKAQHHVESLNTGWEFSRDSLFTTTETVDIPHDFQISQPWVAPAANEKADCSATSASSPQQQQVSTAVQHEISTTGSAVRLIVTPDKQTWKADGEDLQHLRITAVDSKGRKVWDCQDEVSISNDGDARIAAIGNGNIFGDEISTTGNTCHLYKGTALVILRSALKPSTVTLRVSSPKFKTVTCKLISLHQLSIISAK